MEPIAVRRDEKDPSARSSVERELVTGAAPGSTTGARRGRIAPEESDIRKAPRRSEYSHFPAGLPAASLPTPQGSRPAERARRDAPPSNIVRMLPFEGFAPGKRKVCSTYTSITVRRPFALPRRT
jgi:hypothetical protein